MIFLKFSGELTRHLSTVVNCYLRIKFPVIRTFERCRQTLQSVQRNETMKSLKVMFLTPVGPDGPPDDEFTMLSRNARLYDGGD